MRGNKHVFAIVFCCAFVFIGSAKAMFPVFDLLESPQTFSKVPVVFDQVKNLKDQLTSMTNNLKAMGDKIKSIAMFAKDVADKVVDASEEVSGYSDEINERLNLNGDSARGTEGASREVENTTSDVTDTTVDETESIIDGEEDQNDIELPSSPSFPGKSPMLPVENPVLPIGKTPILSIENEGGSQKLPEAETPTLPVLDKPIAPKLPNVEVPVLPVESKPVAPKLPSVEKPILPVVSKPIVSTLPVKSNLSLDRNKSNFTAPIELDLQIEEEEEEEEVSIEEEKAKIEAVKESIKNALQNCKDINVQFNDLLDLSINSIQQNSDANSKTLEKIAQVINSAEKLDISEKNAFLGEVKIIKEKELKLTDNLIGIVDGVKTSYNSSYKNKIEDGYKNYEKLAIAYIKGDVSQKEFQEAGKKLKKDAKTLEMTPDRMVIAEVDKKIKEIQIELLGLTKKIKQAEEKKQKI